MFAAGSGRDTVLDFSLAEGDRLQVAASMLGAGIDTGAEIVAEYGEADPAGYRLVFDGGEVIRLAGAQNLTDLAAGILIV